MIWVLCNWDVRTCLGHGAQEKIKGKTITVKKAKNVKKFFKKPQRFDVMLSLFSSSGLVTTLICDYN